MIKKLYLEKLANELRNLKDNNYEKHRIASELVLHEQSLMLKIYIFIGIAILCGFIISTVALLLKMGFNII